MCWTCSPGCSGNSVPHSLNFWKTLGIVLRLFQLKIQFMTSSGILGDSSMDSLDLSAIMTLLRELHLVGLGCSMRSSNFNGTRVNWRHRNEMMTWGMWSWNKSCEHYNRRYWWLFPPELFPSFFPPFSLFFFSPSSPSSFSFSSSSFSSSFFFFENHSRKRREKYRLRLEIASILWRKMDRNEKHKNIKRSGKRREIKAHGAPLFFATFTSIQPHRLMSDDLLSKFHYWFHLNFILNPVRSFHFAIPILFRYSIYFIRNIFLITRNKRLFPF